MVTNSMNRLCAERRVRVVSCLVEGMSVRATCRITGAAKGTVLKLLADLGAACHRFHDRTVRGLQAERVQADEIWAFCYAKDRALPDSMRDRPGVGSVWTWTALDADDKLMIAWHVGTRGDACALTFMRDLASRLNNRVQLSTDGHMAYPPAVFAAFGGNVDYAMLVKTYDEPRGEDERRGRRRCTGSLKTPVCGGPLREDTSTSLVERSNLTLRMQQRRFTRKTNGFSKKLENHQHAVALHFTHYNFVRVHQTLRTTPAVACGLSDHVWTVEELVGLLEAEERGAVANGAWKRGPYRKRP